MSKDIQISQTYIAQTNINLIQDGERCPLKLSDFYFKPFSRTGAKNFKVIPDGSLKLLKLNQENPSKNSFSGQLLTKLTLRQLLI